MLQVVKHKPATSQQYMRIILRIISYIVYLLAFAFVIPLLKDGSITAGPLFIGFNQLCHPTASI